MWQLRLRTGLQNLRYYPRIVKRGANEFHPAGLSPHRNRISSD